MTTDKQITLEMVALSAIHPYATMLRSNLTDDCQRCL